MAKDCTPPPHHVAYVNQLRAERGSAPRQTAAAPPHRAAPAAQPAQVAAPPVTVAQDRKVTLIISVDGYRSYLNDCEVTVILKMAGSYLPPDPGKKKADSSGDIHFEEWTLPGKNCYIEASVWPSLKNIDGTLTYRPPGVAFPHTKRGVIPDDASGTIWFLMSPTLQPRVVDVGIEQNDSTNRGSTSTTNEGSGGITAGPFTAGGKHSVTENSPSDTDGTKRTRTDHITVQDVTGIELKFSQTPPSNRADAGTSSDVKLV